MQGKTEPKPEIQDEDHLEDSTTSRDFPETDIDNNFGSNIRMTSLRMLLAKVIPLHLPIQFLKVV